MMRQSPGGRWRPIPILLVALLATAGPAGADPDDLHDGEQLMLEACVQCHGLRPVRLTRDGTAGWLETVERMVVFGAQLNPAEVDELVGFLARDYGPGAEPMTTGPLPPGAVGPAELPDGEGSELVAALCTSCHDAGRILATRRSNESWSRYLRQMLAQGGIDPAPQQLAVMETYLQTNFGAGP